MGAYYDECAQEDNMMTDDEQSCLSLTAEGRSDFVCRSQNLSSQYSTLNGPTERGEEEEGEDDEGTDEGEQADPTPARLAWASQLEAGFQRDLVQPTEALLLEQCETLSQVLCSLWPELQKAPCVGASEIFELARFLSVVNIRQADLVPGRVHKVCRYISSLETILRHQQWFMCFACGFFSGGEEHALQRAEVNICTADLLSTADLRGTLMEGVPEVRLEHRVAHLRLRLKSAVDIYRRSVQAVNQAGPVEEGGDGQEGEAGEPTDPAAAAAAASEGPQKPHQQLLEFLVDLASSRGYRRKNKRVYAPVMLPDGTFTNFYRNMCDIQDFVYQSVDKNSNPGEFYALTLKESTPRQVANLLANVRDSRFPFLDKKRTLFSYRNGIFDCLTGKFHLYLSQDYVHPEPGDLIGSADELDGQATSNFFDFEVPLEWFRAGADPGATVPTPHFDKILDDQQWDQKTKNWLMIMLGRLIFPVGLKDDWQSCPYIRGVAGSGKSTILNLMRRVYSEEENGVLMGDGEGVFCDQAFYDKNIVFAMDIDAKTNFSTTRLNSYISGEVVSVARKYATPVVKEWDATLIFASNHMPPFLDVAGNIARRILIFLFMHAITNGDGKLAEKCRAELPGLLIRIVKMYLGAVALYGNRSHLFEIPGLLPKMLVDSRRQFLVHCSTLTCFLESPEHVLLDPSWSVDVANFKRALVAYARENKASQSFTDLRLTAIDHGQLFRQYNCQLECRNDTVVRILGMAVLYKGEMRGVQQDSGSAPQD